MYCNLTLMLNKIKRQSKCLERQMFRKSKYREKSRDKDEEKETVRVKGYTTK